MGFWDSVGKAVGSEIKKNNDHLQSRANNIQDLIDRYEGYSNSQLKDIYENGDSDERIAAGKVLQGRR